MSKTNTEMCRNILETGKCKNKICFYAHNEKELRKRKTPLKYKLDECIGYANGDCPYGKRCNFKHYKKKFFYNPFFFDEITNMFEKDGVNIFFGKKIDFFNEKMKLKIF